MNKVINSVLIVGSLVLLGGACYKTIDTNVNVAGNTNVVDSNTNALVNTNTVLNTNAEVNINVSNTNSSVNTNTPVVKNGWTIYTNEEFGFSFSYPEEWKLDELGSTSYVPGLALLENVSLNNQEQESQKNVQTNFSVTDLSLEELITKIEESDQLTNGESLAKVSGVNQVKINDIEGYQATHKTAIGIPVIFYFFPVDGNRAIFIFYSDLDQSRNSQAEEIIGTLVLNYPF